jgi:hypothetical protein
VDHRFGNGEASLLGVELLDDAEKPIREVFGGQRVIIRVSVQFNQDVQQPIIGYTLRDRLGVEIAACNTSYVGRLLPAVFRGDLVTSDFHTEMPNLTSGSYSISPAVARGNVLKHDMCDWIDNALVFSLQSADLIYGMMKLDVEVVNYIAAAADAARL